MKKITIIILCLIALSCKAQSLIKPLGEIGSCSTKDTNCYDKDVSNEFDKYLGNWKYIEGNIEINITFKKQIYYQINSESNYQDLLVGEYQYINNGNEIANTLNDINNPNIYGYLHKLSGNLFIHNLPSYYCEDNGNISDIKIQLNISHPSDEYVSGQFIMRHYQENGIEKLDVCVYDETTFDTSNRTLIPNGQYIFIKQN